VACDLIISCSVTSGFPWITPALLARNQEVAKVRPNPLQTGSATKKSDAEAPLSL
jgi:hypothetical protein